MHFNSASLAALALATSVAAKNHVVEVGMSSSGPAYAYNPSVVTASKGDTVTFEYYPSEHTVTQGDPDKACSYMDGGFYSTLVKSTSEKEANTKTEFVITINDTKPIWYFCSYEDHCSNGMVGVINGPTSDYTKYKAAAMKFKGMAGFPKPGTKVFGGVTQPASAAKTSSAAAMSSTPNAASANSVAGGVVAFAALGLGFLGL